MKMFARFSIARENATENPNEFAGDPPSNPFIDRSYAFVIGHTWVIGANKTNQVILGEVVQKFSLFLLAALRKGTSEPKPHPEH